MNGPIVEVQGTLHADGTLVLDEALPLPPGRVRVSVQAVERLPKRNLLDALAEIRASQSARGYVPPTAEEFAARLAQRDLEDAEYEEWLVSARLESSAKPESGK